MDCKHTVARVVGYDYGASIKWCKDCGSLRFDKGRWRKPNYLFETTANYPPMFLKVAYFINWLMHQKKAIVLFLIILSFFIGYFVGAS